MTFTLLPDLAWFFLAFALIAIVAVGASAVTATTLLAEHRSIRLRRHEGVRSYYGHLAHLR